MTTGLVSALSGLPLAATRERSDLWGRLVESAVGAHLINTASSPLTSVGYWRDGVHEVDFVLRSGSMAVALEVQSGRQAVNRAASTVSRELTGNMRQKHTVGGSPMPGMHDGDRRPTQYAPQRTSCPPSATPATNRRLPRQLLRWVGRDTPGRSSWDRDPP
ncbi:MAG: DUF4143 domain-containing protein [Pseudonocardiaceae bacterium]